MVTFEEKSLVTRIVGRIKEILEEVSANPKDYDLLKSSVEIYELVLRSLREDYIWRLLKAYSRAEK